MTPKGPGSVHDMQNVIWTCCPTDSRLHDGGPGKRRPTHRRPSSGKPLLPFLGGVFFISLASCTLWAQCVLSSPSVSRNCKKQPDVRLSGWPRDPRYVQLDTQLWCFGGEKKGKTVVFGLVSLSLFLPVYGEKKRKWQKVQRSSSVQWQSVSARFSVLQKACTSKEHFCVIEIASNVYNYSIKVQLYNHWPQKGIRFFLIK